MFYFTCVLVLLFKLVILVIIYFYHRLNYWKRLGIPHDKPTFPQGNLKGIAKTRHLKHFLMDNYQKYKNKAVFGGFYFYLNPAVVLYDLDLIKDVLVKDFNNFSDRGLFHNERDDPLSANIFRMDGAKWKRLRNSISPLFSSAKLKEMVPVILTVGENLLETFEKRVKNSTNSIIEVSEICTRFSVDVIGSWAFGINCNSLNDKNAEFYYIAEHIFKLKTHSKPVTDMIQSFPVLAQKLRVRHFHPELEYFFVRIAREIVEYRQKNLIKRKDLLNSLIELKNSEEGLTLEQIASQSFAFFLAGFEPPSTILTFALFELAYNQDIQDKLRTEIQSQMEKVNGKLSYECLWEMHYLNNVVKETLRKYPTLVNHVRVAKDNYPTSDSKYTIPKGAMVIIPIEAIHYDPEIFSDPDKFNPQRFCPEETQKRHPIAWLPFGDGPRHCMGSRFAKMQIYVGLISLLQNYKFYSCEETTYPLEIDVGKTPLMPRNEVFLRVERI